MVRQILTISQITNSPDFYNNFIKELPAKNKAPKDPITMRAVINEIFMSLSDIIQKKVSTAAGLRTKFSKIFGRFRSGQHDSTEFILKLAQT